MTYEEREAARSGRSTTSARLAQSAEEGLGAVVRALGSLFTALGEQRETPRAAVPPLEQALEQARVEQASVESGAEAPTQPPSTPLARPGAGAPRAEASEPGPTGRLHAAPEDSEEDLSVDLMLEEARAKAYRIIDESVREAQALIARRRSPDPQGIERLRSDIAALSRQVAAMDQRLGRIEELLRAQQAAGPAEQPRASMPSAPTAPPPPEARPESPAVPEAPEEPAASAAPSPPPPAPEPPARESERRAEEEYTEGREPAYPLPEPGPAGEAESRAAERRPAQPTPPPSGAPTLSVVPPSNGTPRAETPSPVTPPPPPPEPAGAVAVEPQATAQPLPAAPVEEPEPESAPEAAQEPERSEPRAEEAREVETEPEAPEPRAAATVGLRAVVTAPPRVGRSEPAYVPDGDHGDRLQFAPEAGSVVLRVSPVSGFQGLMRVQDALVHLPAIQEATVEAYSQGEARLRVRLRVPVTTAEIASGLAGRLGQPTHVAASSQSERTVRLALG